MEIVEIGLKGDYDRIVASARWRFQTHLGVRLPGLSLSLVPLVRLSRLSLYMPDSLSLFSLAISVTLDQVRWWPCFVVLCYCVAILMPFCIIIHIHWTIYCCVALILYHVQNVWFLGWWLVSSVAPPPVHIVVVVPLMFCSLPLCMYG